MFQGSLCLRHLGPLCAGHFLCGAFAKLTPDQAVDMCSERLVFVVVVYSMFIV